MAQTKSLCYKDAYLFFGFTINRRCLGEKDSKNLIGNSETVCNKKFLDIFKVVLYTQPID